MTQNNRLFGILVPVISVLLGLLAGAIIMLVSGYSPIEGYAALWNGAFGDAFTIGETIRRITPLILTGLAVAFAFRSGLFNIGAEGQVIVGWLAAVWVGLAVDAPMILHLPLVLIVAMLAGALWGFVPGLLKAKLGVHEVIVTIMMNYIALFITNEIIRNVLTEQETTTEAIPATASLASEWLQTLTFFSRMHYGILVALFAAIIMWFIVQRTTIGYELKAVGFNQHASRYAGMNVSKNIILSMVISGAFAGLAGAMEGVGTYGTISVMSGFTNLGFDGIAVALLGSNNALGVVLAAILFGVLKEGAGQMPTSAGVPTELVDIIIALIIFFVASSYIIRWFLLRFKKEGK
ncbi:ABC transporter permease [Virgibacillus halodenitrificans]|jgi:general nucleoside transport system permease protein|uniref:ABC transporter permease n=1 Tax=Virgibacillus halodenitrificans TaxID=1482 RepID=A0AAC9IZC5_VIRHA|nr:ABC transporter permease [Virgibacillus halodenitrificans]APC48571.1 branched-chain amino acid ABC transporter permease [Virgibacillus halodenitrificans]MBD1224226.1 ABC transporter permease [Virgibacillus halodenitrificans]MCG1028761.1 ABC transporter permease [Virgibacillus halodenitrificans]MCJ0931145.1 ABC transporter permease [Virgibacillus halodenitrificans]MEC2161138.1 ABC transporter permease [Virgibacillus halodenitrificans]